MTSTATQSLGRSTHRWTLPVNDVHGHYSSASVACDAMLLDHLSIQCRDVAASAAFYDAVLAPLQGERVMSFGDTIGFGVGGRPTFWLGPLTTGEPNREIHIAFVAPDRAAVRAFFQAATASGAAPLHDPRLWPEYHATYYGAFVRDPDGNNVEAVCHGAE